MKKFEVGSTYQMHSICDSNCIWTYKVIARTACTITLEDDHGEVKRCRINQAWSKVRDAETVLPLGNYSMAPALSADKMA